MVVSLLLHLVAFDLLPHWTIDPGDEPLGKEPLRATLLPPITPDAPAPPPVQSSVPPPAPSAGPPPAPRVVSRRPLPSFVPESLEPVPTVKAGVDASPAPNGSAAGVAPGPAASAEAVPAANAAVSPAPPTTPAPPIAAVAPQSARLSYKVVYTDQKNASPIVYNGIGTIDWSIADGRYRSTLLATVPILFVKVDVLAAHSEGSVTSAGVLPDRYTESPRKRATVAVNFNRDARQSITFSATPASAPLAPGVQDRLSLLFQIGGLLLAHAAEGADGGRIEMPVAGTRGGVEPWTFVSQGPESIVVALGTLATTHLRRTPRPDSNDRIIDVWIAQQDGGYPARVLYTEPNGSTIEMVLEKIGAIE